MSTTVKAANVEAVPFFARFLEEQSPDSPPPPPDSPPFPFPFTLKFPSDSEDS